MGGKLLRSDRSKLTFDFFHITNATVHLILVFSGLTAYTAHYPRNKAISSATSIGHYSIEKKEIG